LKVSQRPPGIASCVAGNERFLRVKLRTVHINPEPVPEVRIGVEDASDAPQMFLNLTGLENRYAPIGRLNLRV
jgi:hypothetical protein